MSMFTLSCNAQIKKPQMNEDVQKVVLAFEKATAQQNIEEINTILHQDYRVIANRFKGTKTATIITKEMYLGMMKAKKIGGTIYQTDFISINVTEHTAIVDVLFVGEKNSMHKYLILIQDENNQWKIVSDVPIVIK